MQAFLGCERAALRRGATSAADLAACRPGAAVAVARATAKLGADVGARCAGVATDVVLPGACAGRTGAALASCVGERVACRVCRLLDSTGALDADCDAADDGLANQSCRMPVSVSGDAIPFNGGDGRVAGAEIWILEHPEMRVVTGADGHFRFDGLDEGSEVTLVLDHPDYHPIQTGTMRLGPLGAERVTFQAVVYPIYSALGALLNLVPDDEHACQMVTTLTRVGRSLYDPGAHGEADATVTLDPALPAEHGPIYFNALVLPDRSLTRSSDDGGALFVQVPPGEYVWTATKAGAAFSRIKMKCRVGLLVNASPPWGLQRQ
ncbi:MAG: carboxypeptidase-like regulatory domain-containing protein [Candidatus Binatia bacterium]